MPVLIHTGIWMSFRQGRCFHQTNKADVPYRMSHEHNRSTADNLQGGHDSSNSDQSAGEGSPTRLTHRVGEPSPAHSLPVIELIKLCAESAEQENH